MIENVIETPFQALQITFEMQSKRTSQEKIVKKICFYKLKNLVFSF
jgi:hypothetical protein